MEDDPPSESDDTFCGIVDDDDNDEIDDDSQQFDKENKDIGIMEARRSGCGSPDLATALALDAMVLSLFDRQDMRAKVDKVVVGLCFRLLCSVKSDKSNIENEGKQRS